MSGHRWWPITWLCLAACNRPELTATGEDGNRGSHGQVCTNYRILEVSVGISESDRQRHAVLCVAETKMWQSLNISLKIIPFMDGH